MDRGAVARGRPIDLARIGLGIGDELGHRFGRHRRIDFHHVRHPHDAGNRRGIADEIEGQLGIKRGVDRIRRIDQQQRVTVRRRMNCRFGADIVARARLILDEDLLAQTFRQPLRHDARRDVRAPAGGVGDDPTHRPGRVFERRGAADPAPCEDGQADGETAGKIHGWNHGACLLLPVFLVANEPAIAVPFANLRAKVRGIEALAQGRQAIGPRSGSSRSARARPRAIAWGCINQPSLQRPSALRLSALNHLA